MPAHDFPPARDIALPDLAATEALAGALAGAAEAGDVLALSGGLGAGKTAFARAFIHARQDASDTPREEVPSPTFTLVQVYDLPGAAIWHFDLYRLAAADEAFELGLDEALADGIALIEWPERLGGLLPDARLDLEFGFDAGEGSRTVRLEAHGATGRRLMAAAP